MEYRHSTLWPQTIARQCTRTETKAAAIVSTAVPGAAGTPVDHVPPSVDEVNAHMQQWADAGWELVSANQSPEKWGFPILPVYAFFWRRG
jgi:hypothetical protein